MDFKDLFFAFLRPLLTSLVAKQTLEYTENYGLIDKGVPVWVLLKFRKGYEKSWKNGPSWTRRKESAVKISLIQRCDFEPFQIAFSSGFHRRASTN